MSRAAFVVGVSSGSLVTSAIASKNLGVGLALSLAGIYFAATMWWLTRREPGDE